jgi:hypothetical protein
MTATPVDEAGLWLRASPRGRRAGLVAVSDESGGTITVTVLPKMWADDPVSIRRLHCQAGTTSHLAAYETDYVHLTGTAQVLGAILLNLSKVGGAGQAELLVPCPPPMPEPHVAATTGDQFNSLIDLMLVAEKGGIDTSEVRYDGKLTESLMRLLAQERLLQAVEPLLFRARPTYIEHVEALSTPRGRLHDRSLLLASATGQPRIDCTFDELTMDTPLLRVMKSSLYVIATDRLPPRIAALSPRTQPRAVQLLRHLPTIQLISRESAELQADRLWLGPLERNWEPALEAAKPVLRELGIIPEDEPAESADSVAIHVFTEKFWEQTVEAILQAAFGEVSTSAGGSSGPGVTAPPPWIPADPAAASDTYPDYMFNHGTRVILADAKYKLDAALGASDGYQLFAYSHLASLRASPSNLALVLYPTTPRSEPGQQRWLRLPDRNYPLWLVSLPFPARADVRSQAAWNQYIAQGASALGTLSSEWNIPSAGTSSGISRHRACASPLSDHS